ncbi:MAG: metallopeptidase family protein [Actinobacteria bacterium]|nr:metallopeptidase family protein [Actinomycetota bacterium]MBU1608488.1 metallopeptidase family protein [Actinomycetota bacterium]MBU2316686.1 metallopeptidase family protein [Actinomycetota bacterium]MBU2385476.1 metallopeptidase family protein [Actinomycetota bacterium]QOD93027.1 metallopeptidase family protein [Chryseoglobus sp. 28M-23]
MACRRNRGCESCTTGSRGFKTTWCACSSRARAVPTVSSEPAELDLDEAAFERLVVEELDALPDEMVDGLDNVIFVTEARPEDGSLDLLGLYEGVALTDRGQYGFGELPDRIILYREPLLAAAEGDLEELHEQIHITLVHEIAHFYGIDDDELHRLGWA